MRRDGTCEHKKNGTWEGETNMVYSSPRMLEDGGLHCCFAPEEKGNWDP